jgi:glycosyltransferase involved in cell wall biosynthesis
MSKIKASVIIPTKDKINRLILILRCLANQINQEVEVIVVFDGCSPGVIAKCDSISLSYQPRKIVSAQNVGRAAARNLGLHAASGEIIIFLDDDRIPAPDFLAKHLVGHRKRCVLIGERKQVKLPEEEIERIALDSRQPNFQDIYQRAYVEFFNVMTKKILLSPHSNFRWLGLATGNVSMAREDLLKVGGFDEGFTGWGYEDIELGYRLFRDGIPFIKDSSIINYHLMHEYPQDKNHEEFKNIQYFMKKIGTDFIPMTILTLLLLRLNIRVFLKIYS